MITDRDEKRFMTLPASLPAFSVTKLLFIDLIPLDSMDQSVSEIIQIGVLVFYECFNLAPTKCFSGLLATILDFSSQLG